jgi:hypothetical protein
MRLKSEQVRDVIVFVLGTGLFLYLGLTSEGRTRVVALLWVPLLTYWIFTRFRDLKRRERDDQE